MSNVEVKVDVAALTTSIKAYGDKVRAVRMDVLGALIAEAVDDLIQSEGETGTQGKWEPFSPNTLKRHPNRVGGKILQASGLLGNMQVFSDESSRTAEIRSPAPYAGFHATGTRRMPKRDFFALDFGKVLDEIGSHVVQRVVSV